MQAAPTQEPKAISDLSRRLRVLEDRYTILRRKSQLTDENLLESERDARKTIQQLKEEMSELHRIMIDIDDKLDRFLEQVKQAAPRQDVLILKKYAEMWDPMQYLTREEARRLLKDREFKNAQ